MVVEFTTGPNSYSTPDAAVVASAVNRFHGINGGARVKNHRGEVEVENARRRRPISGEKTIQAVTDRVTAHEIQEGTPRGTAVESAVKTSTLVESPSYHQTFGQVEAAWINGPRTGTLSAPATTDHLAALDKAKADSIRVAAGFTARAMVREIGQNAGVKNIKR